jgi:NAD(P)-dependent dehydrogenase (short-subunit alcohol dehydrogenase family)
VQPDDAKYPSLKDRVVFVTGGGSGIGESIVEHFCAQDAKVTFVDIAAAPSEALVERIGKRGHRRPRFIQADLRDVAALKSAISKTCDADGAIRVLVNNAGNDDRHVTAEVTPDYWDDRMAVNLRHQFFAAQTVRPQMRDAGGGSIINFGSITWLVADTDCIAYVTAKSAINGMTRALAHEFGKERIRVNCVMPGWVMTQRQLDLWVNAEGVAQLERSQSLPDRLHPPDIARMVLFLGSDDSRMCSSQNFIVDGGWV